MYVRTRLGRWFYEERGAPRRDGAPAVVLWPSLLFDGSMWRHQLAPLSELGRVLVFDGPGHGKSEVPPPFTLEDNAEALLDVFEALQISRAVLVGLSWGGMLAMRMALQHPERVAALALFDTSAEAEDRAKALKYRAFASFGRRLGLPPSLVEGQIAPAMFCDRTLAERRDLVERWKRDASGYPSEGTARAAMAVVVQRKTLLPRLGDIRVPTLVACGREDRATEPVHSERIAAAILGARLVWIEHAGHITALEQPEAVSAALVPFVREQLG
jgi:pimeloyl-ACP methyl ester carboxylesterase